MKELAITRLEQLIQDNNPKALRSQYKNIRNDFFAAKRTIFNELREAFENEWKEKVKEIETANAALPEDAPKAEVPEKPRFEAPTDPLDEKFEELQKQADEILQALEKQIAAEKQQKLNEKQDILAKITECAHSVGATGIGDTFKQFNALQEAWKQVGNIDDPRYKDLQLTYSYQVDLFYHNVNLMKEMRELDFKLNMEKKNHVIAKMEQVAEMESITQMEAHLKELQHEWKGIGPVPADNKDDVNQRFREATDLIFGKIRAHYGERKQNLHENLQAKQTLIDRVAAILETDLSQLKTIQEKTEEVLAIQEEWRKIGPSERNEEVWQTFRETCDKFFDLKQSHFKGLDQEREKNKLAKIALCEQAEAMQHDTDWKRTADLLVKLQQEWKKIGATRISEERKLWDRFRTACDKFFDAKKTFFGSREQSEQENLTKKEELIERVKNYELAEDRDENYNQLQAFSKEWKEIGFVPLKEKERLQAAFTAALDEKYDKLKLDREQRLAHKFKSRVQQMASGNNNVNQVVKSEQQAIKNRIEELQADISQYENNLGFFTNAKPDNPLLKEVREKIAKLKREVSDLYLKLKMLTEAKAEAEKAATAQTVAETTPTTEAEEETLPMAEDVAIATPDDTNTEEA